MKKLFTLIMMLLMFGCSGDDPVSGGYDDDPVLVGCEAATFYDWDSIEFEGTLDGGANTWLAFNLDETTLFSINLNQAGFHCLVFEACDGEYGTPPPLYDFQTNGNGVEVGIVTAGTYYLEVTNTRPGRLDFDFSISLADIVYGCMNNDAINYDDTANIDDGNCLFNDCTTDYWTSNFGDMILDCDGNCAPANWVGDGWCDDGAYSVVNEEGEEIPVNLWCDELNFDEGDCEVIVEDCTEGEIVDC